MTENEIRPVADGVLREHLAAFGYRGVSVRVEPDQDGNAAIGISAQIKSPPDSIEKLPLLAVAGAMRRALLERGEDRFPYVSYTYPTETSPNELL